ncbi:MAG TPA: hypothetical protein VIJ60_14130, partial [Acidimicrobiales bacterium]
PDVMVRVRLDQPPIRRIAARAADVAGFGWRSFAPAPLAHPVAATVGGAGGDAVGNAPEGAVVLANGLVAVVVDPTDGTFAVDGLAGFGRLVDGGDLGDSYNYSPPRRDATVDAPETVTVVIGDRGPVRATAVVTATYRWPDHVDGTSQARVGDHLVDVTTTIDVRADEPTVRVTTGFVNPSRDHRLRVHLPLPEPATESEAECAFATVRRGLTAEGRPDELGLPTFPSRRFVRAGGLTVVHDGVAEYELVDITGGAGGNDTASGAGGDNTVGGSDGAEPVAHALALTLLRSTGMLSRLGRAYRPFPAGPLTPVDGLQLVGRRIEARYAVAVGPVDPWTLADDVLLPLEVVGSLGGGWRPAHGSALDVDGAEVTAVRRVAGLLEVRVFNPSPETTTVSLGARAGWLVDLRGRPLEPVEGHFPLRPHGIATVRLSRE